jgi:hypothetical protein
VKEVTKMAGKPKYASRTELLEAIKAGATKEMLAAKFGYKSIGSLNSALKHYFASEKLKTIAEEDILPSRDAQRGKRRQSPMQNFWSNVPQIDKRTMGECFDNPIAAQDFRSGWGYNRIEEIWAREGLA